MTLEMLIIGVGFALMVLWTLGMVRTGLTSMMGPDGGSMMMLVSWTVLSIFGVGWVVLTLTKWNLRVGRLVWRLIYYRRKRTVAWFLLALIIMRALICLPATGSRLMLGR